MQQQQWKISHHHKTNYAGIFTCHQSSITLFPWGFVALASHIEMRSKRSLQAVHWCIVCIFQVLVAKDVAELPSIPPSAINLNIKMIKGVSHCLPGVFFLFIFLCLFALFSLCLDYSACLPCFSYDCITVCVCHASPSVCIALLVCVVLLFFLYFVYFVLYFLLCCTLVFCFVSLFITAFACRVCFFCLANACWTGLVLLFLQCCSACFSLFSVLQHSSCHCFCPVCLTALLCLLAVFYSGSVVLFVRTRVCVLKSSHP